MWNILIVLIIAIVIWMVNPFAHFNSKVPMVGVSEEIHKEVQQVQDQTVEQIQYARELQQQEQSSINNP